ncbi:PREDICTED: uncharacterized protein LOC109589061 [Amphimedon queenslandica]|uniref:Uncharacterized protein n=1 Tax=Amphimedon queenslandica TaxID=400682 RepID=A0A1X7VNB7_AMPQE|nr:PREDICTED: uncharacterized protein LOC109589061 [Amphimedon queenslandica]|eukprot:XP_019860745.1 PREDICTED: uncharacterized protein LOC109589061 [Amphimedon queenslandica]
MAQKSPSTSDCTSSDSPYVQDAQETENLAPPRSSVPPNPAIEGRLSQYDSQCYLKDATPFLLKTSYASCIEIEGVYYIGVCGCIYKLGIENKWKCIDCLGAQKLFGLGRLEEKLAVVGGLMHDTGKVTGDVICYDNGKRLESKYPAMPTPRSSPTIASSDRYLIAIGGRNDDDALLPIIEIHDSKIRQWYKSRLFIPNEILSSRMSAVLVDDSDLFVAGNLDEECGNKCITASLNYMLGRKGNQFSQSALQVGLSLAKPIADGKASGNSGYNENNPTSDWNYTEKTPKFGTIALSNKTIFLFSGDKVFTYHQSTNEWAYRAKIDKAVLAGASALVLKESILFIGGKIDGEDQKTVKEFVVT